MRGTLQPAGAEILHRRSREPSAVNAFMNITALARQGNPASLTLYYPWQAATRERLLSRADRLSANLLEVQ